MFPEHIQLYIGWLNNYSDTYLLGIFTLIVAFQAYRNSIRKKYESWKTLLTAFKSELEFNRHWFKSKYDDDRVRTRWYSPGTQVYEITSIASGEVARQGIPILSKSKYGEELPIKIVHYNQKILTLNKLIEHQRMIIAADPVLSAELISFVQDQQKKWCDNNSPEIKQVIEDLEKSDLERDKDKFRLACMMKIGFERIHRDIIGKELYDIYHSLMDGIDQLLQEFDTFQLWWLKKFWSWTITIFAVVTFLIIGYWF